MENASSINKTNTDQPNSTQADSLTMLKTLSMKIRQGDSHAFETLFNLYQAKLLSFVRRSLVDNCDAEEIVQEVFLKIWRKRETIDIDGNLQAYLYTVAKNMINDHLRSLIHQKKYLDSLLNESPTWNNDVEQTMSYQETQEIISRLINELPDKRRKVFEMSRLQGKTYLQISEELNISENTVDTQMRKALRFMKESWMKLSLMTLLILRSL